MRVHLNVKFKKSDMRLLYFTSSRLWL